MCLPTRVRGSSIQSIAAAVGNLLCLNFGLSFGITPAHTVLYESELLTPLNRVASATDTAWLTGYLFLTAAIAALVSGWVALRIGPKSVLLLSGLLQITGWFCIHFGYNLTHIYCSRMFAGIAGGAAFVVLPIYINEITETREKAASLTFTLELWRTLGILLGIILGYNLRYDYVNIVGCGASIFFSMCFPFVQESPYYFLRKGKLACMEKSLRWFRGIRDIDDRDKPEYLQELDEFKAQMQGKSKSIGSMPISQCYVARLLLISLLLTTCAQFSGIFVEFIYADDFLNSTGYSTEVNYVLLAGAAFLGALLAQTLGPKMPRKLLLCLSSMLAAFSIIALAIFTQFGQQWHLGAWCNQYLPLLLMAFQLFFLSFGLYPLGAVISGEVLPAKIHDVLYSLSSAFSWLLLFGMIETFNDVKSKIGLVPYLWLFASATIFIGLVSLVLIPETRHRSSSMLQQQLGYTSGNGDVAKSAYNGNITTNI